ncbi:hypothetical protein LY90DRAFT_697679 [Neocallimastix californiae]|uniref:Bromodomain-domain-containing protein n=1 Tax=Neocallimastix californiae TaxID=1754190 RepID=A0A1Y2FCR1_9FUNG|nr:hypothetical protein LY90DRAFT_697679 [Neocallimastix californiae]|eukprot:ORY81703.1 hypothetical protein LY90DRAFT_697679 [Neocallimastix californiae]
MVAVVKNEFINEKSMEKENEKNINGNKLKFKNNNDKKVEKEESKNAELNDKEKNKMEVDNNDIVNDKNNNETLNEERKNNGEVNKEKDNNETINEKHNNKEEINKEHDKNEAINEFNNKEEMNKEHDKNEAIKELNNKEEMSEKHDKNEVLIEKHNNEKINGEHSSNEEMNEEHSSNENINEANSSNEVINKNYSSKETINEDHSSNKEMNVDKNEAINEEHNNNNNNNKEMNKKHDNEESIKEKKPIEKLIKILKENPKINEKLTELFLESEDDIKDVGNFFKDNFLKDIKRGDEQYEVKDNNKKINGKYDKEEFIKTTKDEEDDTTKIESKNRQENKNNVNIEKTDKINDLDNDKTEEENNNDADNDNTIKMEESSEISNTSHIGNREIPLERNENDRIVDTVVENEISNQTSNQTDISKDSNEISINSQNYISPLPINNSKNINKHMPRSESSVCSHIIKSLQNHPNAPPFLKPVDPVALNIPDYFNVIKYPMDFSTISKKLKHGKYPSMVEFVDDVDLVFRNCMTYNPPANPVHIMGKELKNYFIEQLKKYPDHFSDILLNKFNIDLSTIEKRPRRQIRPPQHFEPEDELLMKKIKQQQKRSLMEQHEVKTYVPKIKEETRMTMEPYDEEMDVDEKPVKASKTVAKVQKVRKIAKGSKVASKKIDREDDEEEEMIEEMEDSDEYSSTTDSEDELVESQITALTACVQQLQQQLELLQAQSSISRHTRKKSKRSLSSFSEYYSNTEKESPVNSKTLATTHKKINSTSNISPTPAPTRGRKKQNNIRKTAITNSALQTTGTTRKRSKAKSETSSPAKRSPANRQGRVCEYCGGSETPMWRRGPSGKGSLCNKCGVKWKSGKIYKGEPIPSQSGLNSANSSAVSTPNVHPPPPKTKRRKIDAPPKKPRVQSITYAQKKELSEMIGKLDEDNLNGVIDIIRSGIPDLKDGQEEIELDIETIDPVTLRKLYRYVKKVSKPVKVVQKPITQELQNYSDYSSGSSDSGEESNDGE